MGCNSNTNARTVELPKELTIYGHILDTQTRSLKMSCEVSGKKYKFCEVDFLKEGGRPDDYLKVNPTGAIPMIQEG